MSKYIAKIDGGMFQLDMTEAHKAYKEASLIKARWSTLQVGEVADNGGVRWGNPVTNPCMHSRIKQKCQVGMLGKIVRWACATSTVFLISILISQGIK